MTVVDVVIIFVICLSALFSLLRGFVKEAISLATWILAVWIAATLAPKLTTVLPAGIESEAVRQATAFGILFILTLMIGALANFMVAQFVKKTGLTGADRVFGVFFGLLRGMVIIVVFVVVGRMTPLPDFEWWQDSDLLYRFGHLADLVQDYVPDDMMEAPAAIVQ